MRLGIVGHLTAFDPGSGLGEPGWGLRFRRLGHGWRYMGDGIAVSMRLSAVCTAYILQYSTLLMGSFE